MARKTESKWRKFIHMEDMDITFLSDYVFWWWVVHSCIYNEGLKVLKKTKIKLKKTRQQNNNKNIFFSCKIIKKPILLHTAAIAKPKGSPVTNCYRHNLLYYLILLNDLLHCWIRAFYLSISLPLLYHLCWPIEFSPEASWTAGLHSVWPLVFSDWPCAVQALTPGEIQSLGWIPLHPSNGDLTRPNKSHLSELNSGTRNREYRTWLAFQAL